MAPTGRPRTLAPVILAFGLAPALLAENGSAGPHTDLFDLRTVPRILRSGGVPAPAARLLLGGTPATRALCAEVDAHPAAAAPDYDACLFWFLGVMKDSSTIPWLRGQLPSPNREHVYGAWLRAWPRLWPVPREAPGAVVLGTDGFHQPLDDAGAWAAFFVELFDTARTDDERQRVLETIVFNFCEREAVELLRRVAADAGARLELRLMALVGLWRSDDSGFERCAPSLIDVLYRRSDTATLLADHIPFMPDARFVPVLLEVMRRDASGRDALEPCLRAVTLADDVRGVEAWAAWWETHRHESHRDWLHAAVGRALDLAARDAEAAQARFRELVLLTAPDARSLWELARVLDTPALHSGLICALWTSYDVATHTVRRAIAEEVVRRSGAWSRRDVGALRQANLFGNEDTWYPWQIEERFMRPRP